MNNKIDQIASSVECQDERIETASQSQLEMEKIVAINNLTRAVLIIAKQYQDQMEAESNADEIAKVRSIYDADA